METIELGPSEFHDKMKLKSGDVLINPEYAKTLTKISKNGAKTFYNG